MDPAFSPPKECQTGTLSPADYERLCAPGGDWTLLYVLAGVGLVLFIVLVAVILMSRR